MRKKLYLTMDPEVYSYLKKNKRNVSSHIEKLILKDRIKSDLSTDSERTVTGHGRFELPTNRLRVYCATRLR